ncbi:MAG: hypothetical protein QNJ12_11970 [Ilumatobacter sp.]|uniref:hypothetical protein n=1 Tax=Ilumatobacter sp. TaxID=1967498 RepID=UPI0026123C20|nr:hypothetical protein [Ilumatobacter sp.]MDJ0769508.1 hypothetical protein [Ilumatobacter sp.]
MIRSHRAAVRLATIAVAVLITSAAGPALARSGDEPIDDGLAGIGVAPAFLAFEAALRGTSYTGSIVLSNGLPGDRHFTFATAGDIADWITFSDGDGRPIDDVVIPHEGATTVQAIIAVPAAVPNGDYTGRIEVSGQPVDGTEGASSAGLSIGAVVAVAIEVGGEMIRAGSFDDVVVEAVEVGLPLQISATFNNSGNVGFDPALDLTITRSGQPVDVISVPPEETIDPGRAESIDVTWDTTDTLPGDYSVEVIATAVGYDFAPIERPFRIEHPGSIERSATLESLEVVSVPELGGTARVRGTLRNESDVAVRSILVAEIERDGTLIGELRSLEVLAPPNNTTSIDVVVEGLEAGAHVVRGKVNYEGRETETLAVSFDVAAPAGTDSGSGIGATTLLALAAVLGLVVAAAVALIRRRRAGPGDTPGAGPDPARPRQPERELAHH